MQAVPLVLVLALALVFAAPADASPRMDRARAIAFNRAFEVSAGPELLWVSTFTDIAKPDCRRRAPLRCRYHFTVKARGLLLHEEWGKIRRGQARPVRVLTLSRNAR